MKAGKYFINFQTLFLLVVTLPYLLWVIFDRSIWLRDVAAYGYSSVNLFSTLINSPLSWPSQLFVLNDAKAPMLFWIGQFFVPAGMLTKSVDTGLLFMQIIILFISLRLVFCILQKLFDDKLVSVIGCLIITSAPLMFSMTTHFWVEPLQLLAVIWFLYIFVHVNEWDIPYILLQLISATSFAMLVKVSSPLYCLFVGLFVFIQLFRKDSVKIRFNRHKLRLILLPSILLSFSMITWYVLNWRTLVNFIKISGTSPLYGINDTFLNTMIYWFQALQKAFFLSPIFYFMIFLFVFALLISFRNNKSQFLITKDQSCNIPVLLACMHVILFMVSFSLAVNRTTRYLLPVLPYVVVLTCWSLKKIKNHILSISVLILFIFQFLLVNFQAFGLMNVSNTSNIEILPAIQKHEKVYITRNINKIMDVTCSDNTKNVSLLGFNTRRLQIKQLQYYIAKKKLPDQLNCKYINMNYYRFAVKEDRYDSDKLFDILMSRKTEFYFALSENILQKHMQRSRNKEQLLRYKADLELLRKIKSSEKFELMSLPGYGDMRIYKYIDEKHL